MYNDSKSMAFATAVVGVSAILLALAQQARIHILKTELHLKDDTVETWKRSYSRALGAMTLPQIINHMAQTTDDFKFDDITRNF